MSTREGVIYTTYCGEHKSNIGFTGQHSTQPLGEARVFTNIAKLIDNTTFGTHHPMLWHIFSTQIRNPTKCNLERMKSHALPYFRTSVLEYIKQTRSDPGCRPRHNDKYK